MEKGGAQLVVGTKLWDEIKPQHAHYYTSFSVGPAFAVAILVETPVAVGNTAWEQGALGPAGG